MCPNSKSFTVKLYNPQDSDKDYNISIKQGTVVLKTLHLPKGVNVYTEDVCFDHDNYSIDMNFEGEFTWEIDNKNITIDKLSYTKDLSFGISSDDRITYKIPATTYRPTTPPPTAAPTTRPSSQKPKSKYVSDDPPENPYKKYYIWLALIILLLLGVLFYIKMNITSTGNYTNM